MSVSKFSIKNFQGNVDLDEVHCSSAEPHQYFHKDRTLPFLRLCSELCKLFGRVWELPQGKEWWEQSDEKEPRACA